MIRYVIVNDRIPRRATFCAACCEAISESYVREPQTRLAYCNHRCFEFHVTMALEAIQEAARYQ